jgi:hypothetical protein
MIYGTATASEQRPDESAFTASEQCSDSSGYGCRSAYCQKRSANPASVSAATITPVVVVVETSVIIITTAIVRTTAIVVRTCEAIAVEDSPRSYISVAVIVARSIVEAIASKSIIEAIASKPVIAITIIEVRAACEGASSTSVTIIRVGFGDCGNRNKSRGKDDCSKSLPDHLPSISKRNCCVLNFAATRMPAFFIKIMISQNGANHPVLLIASACGLNSIQ